MITLIGEDGKKIGEVTMNEAETIAMKAEKDLVMVGKNTYRIADEGKLKYERNKKQKSQRATHRTHKLKEITLGPLIEEHDLVIKAKHIREFLERGLKTKITMKFKGRQMAFKDAGLKKLTNLLMPFVDEKLATIDKTPAFDGRNLIAFLTPIRE